MQLIEVTTARHVRQFHKLPFEIYRGNKAWIPHLKQDIEKIFDPRRNKLFREGGEAIRWLLDDGHGRVIGRVAAFINPRTAHSFKQPTGGLGFFECIDDQAAANRLFDACKDWLAARGMQAMDGPINFGEKLQFWGLLIKNFEAPTTYGMNYNPPYYQALFENYGFREYYKQLLWWRDLLVPAQEVFVRKSEMLLKDPEIRVTNIRGWSAEKFARHFMEVYNDAWGGHEGFKKITFEQALKTFQAMKPVYDPDIIVFVFKKDRPIGFYINLPELNQIFRYVHGNLNLWGKLVFLWHKWRRTPTTMYGLIFGVVKDYQGKGVEGAMIKFAETDIATLGRYKDTVLTWIGDFNPKMIRVCENLGAENYRTFATYRYLFDRNAPFERHPLIGVKEERGTDSTGQENSLS
ncbi:MAG: hypothetical protein N2050_07250 [Flavobacteriales bacterium]|nr:hypothetical protein [Flavobacteriales bacterium]MCX7650331.1 hypothetical protein [Flavobacteriales bacterium]MDW8432103.1 hypothetical protein [Flavobacteriales bacterium]